MALPFNTTPTYNVTIPSTQENVKFRPFLVKEEKALLIAQHSEDQTRATAVSRCARGTISSSPNDSRNA